MIIATAGHVDHGKTHLVRALTGIDTDRLEEEKRRGMTIDLGFAYVDLGGPVPAGFIDVPGHERLVRTMAAGVHHLDLALLVIAADDGPMPQTREHLSLLLGLGLSELAIVLTKIDRVDTAQQAQARAQASALLEGGPLADAPVFAVNSLSGEGIPALRAFLRERQARCLGKRRPQRGHARLAIDRAFSRPGAGLIVTGLLLDGQISLGDPMLLSPREEPVRVRGLRVHEQVTQHAQAGLRCAVNLSGTALSPSDLGRGDWLVAPALASPYERLDVLLRVDQQMDRLLSAREQLQVHLGAGCHTARIAPLAARSLEPGEQGLVQLILDRPVVALYGDRIVVRDPAAQRVLGHGVVLDPFGASKGRSKPERIRWLQALAGADATLPTPLERLLRAAPCGVDLDAARRMFNLQAEDEVDLLKATQAVQFGRRALAKEHFAHWCAALTAAVAAEHEQHPARIGPREGLLLQQVMRHCAPAVPTALALPAARGALQHLLDSNALLRDGPCIRSASHHPVLPPSVQARLDAVRTLLLQAGLRAPIAGELATALGTTRDDMLVFLQEMAILGHLVPVAPNRYFLQADVDRLANLARDLAAESADGRFDAAAYRDRSGIGRNLTIEALEFLDRQGITRRIGQSRVIRHAA